MAAESEFDKQKALLEQKVEFLERQLDEAQKKEREMSAEVKNQKRDHFQSVKDIQTKLETQIKELSQMNEEKSEQLFEWESKHQELETKYE
jgi:chromosome segregation ATPase